MVQKRIRVRERVKESTLGHSGSNNTWIENQVRLKAFFFFFLELNFIVLSIATRHTHGTYMTVHTTNPAQPTTSTNMTLKSIHCPPKEADHRNCPGRLAKEWGLAGNSL